MTARSALLCCALFALLTASCGGSTPHQLQEIESMPARPGDGIDSIGLPALAGLDAHRAASVNGPGWHELQLFESGGPYASANAGMVGESLILNPAAQLAFVLYPVGGFGTDAFPTGMRIQASQNPSGEYFGLVADFDSGRWQVLGPFTDTATIAFPGLEDATAPDRYISPGGICYIGLLAAAGSFSFERVELGVDGGSTGPRPPSLIMPPKGQSSLFMGWAHSPDHLAADFAGYRLERAPQLIGDYAPLETGLIADSQFVDDTITEGQGYRYRLAAEDFSGNRSPWVLFQGFSESGVLPDPLIVVNGPLGPLYGPVTLDIDLSGSIDPQGSGIQDYYISSPSITNPSVGQIHNTDGLFSFELQPGCHLLQFTVQTADMRFSTKMQTLKVYPRWQDSPQLVEDTPLSTSARILHPSMLFGLNGLPTVIGYDCKQEAVMLWESRFGGPGQEIRRLPAYWPVERMTDAIHRDDIVSAVSMDHRAWLAVFGFNGDRWVEGPPLLDAEVLELCSLTYSDNYLFCNRSGSISEDLVAYRLDNLGSAVAIAQNVGDIQRIGAVARESDNSLFLFAQTSTELLWYQLDFTLAVIDSGQIAAGYYGDPRMAEIDPLTGRPLLVIDALHCLWTTQDELGNWSMPLEIDNSAMNRPGADTTVVDNVYCGFAHASGQAHIYRFNGSGWDLHSTLAHSADSGSPMAMMDAEVGERGLDIVDTTADGEMRGLRIADDGSEFLHSFLPRSSGQGSALHAISGSGQLHVSWTDISNAMVEIRYSNDDGFHWENPGPLFGRYYSSGTDKSGSIYYSTNGAFNHHLLRWDGISTVFQRDVPSGFPQFQPALARRSFNDDTYWYAYDPSAQLSVETTGHYDSGNPLLDYTQVTRTPVLRPVWDGTANAIGSRVRMLARAGGTSPAAASLALYDCLTEQYDLLEANLSSQPADLQSDPIVNGRGMATCSYFGNTIYLADQAFFSTGSADGRALRCIVGYQGNRQLRYFGDQPDPLVQDWRRTLSCETTHSYTGLMMLSDVEGRSVELQWSNFGDWEKLPLPDVLKGKGQHEIVEGADGRWHVFYRDNLTDQVWMLSTL